MDTLIGILENDAAMTALVGAITTLVGWFIKNKVEGEKAERALMLLNGAAWNTVGEVAQTYVKARRRANADGKLTEAEKREARTLALRKAKQIIGAKGQKLLRQVMGDHETVEAHLVSAIEARVASVKK